MAPDATAEEIRSAWLDLARVWHPDRFAHDARLRAKAEANLQRINAAWELLSAPAEGGPPRRGVVERLSSTFQAVLGLGDLRDSVGGAPVPPGVSAPAGPIGTSRRSIWVLGLDAARAVRARRGGARRWWSVFVALGLLLGGILMILFTR